MALDVTLRKESILFIPQQGL